MLQNDDELMTFCLYQFYFRAVNAVMFMFLSSSLCHFGAILFRELTDFKSHSPPSLSSFIMMTFVLDTHFKSKICLIIVTCYMTVPKRMFFAIWLKIDEVIHRTKLHLISSALLPSLRQVIYTHILKRVFLAVLLSLVPGSSQISYLFLSFRLYSESHKQI